MKSQNPSKRNLPGVIIAYFLIYVVWGSTYFFIGVALKDFSPFLLGALRFTTAGLILLGICYLRGEQIFKKSLVKRSAVSGIVLLFVDMAVVMLAQRYLKSSLVAIIASSTALMRSSSMKNCCIRKVSVVSCSLFSDVYPGLWEHCMPSTVLPVRKE